MTALTSDRAAFYRARHLPIPKQELLPSNSKELKEVLDALHKERAPWRLIGDGQHARFKLALQEQDYQALRTDNLNKVLHLDKKSGLVHVQAGLQWRDFQEAVQAQGFSLQRYGLHPARATIGGLLARYRPGPAALRGGDLIDGCVALSAYSPKIGDYRYLDAPRKSSGPDIRYHFIGAQGREGAILSATFVVWRPVATHLLCWDDCSLARAAQIMHEIFRAGITISCVHYSLARRRLQIILTAPGQLLRSRLRWLRAKAGEPDLVGDEDAAQRRRQWLEARHPDRRSHPAAKRTRIVWLGPALLNEAPADLFGDDLEELEILSWSAQRAEAFLRYSDQTKPPTPKISAERGYWATWPMIATR